MYGQPQQPYYYDNQDANPLQGPPMPFQLGPQNAVNGYDPRGLLQLFPNMNLYEPNVEPRWPYFPVPVGFNPLIPPPLFGPIQDNESNGHSRTLSPSTGLGNSPQAGRADITNPQNQPQTPQAGVQSGQTVRTSSQFQPETQQAGVESRQVNGASAQYQPESPQAGIQWRQANGASAHCQPKTQQTGIQTRQANGASAHCQPKKQQTGIQSRQANGASAQTQPKTQQAGKHSRQANGASAQYRPKTQRTGIQSRQANGTNGANGASAQYQPKRQQACIRLREANGTSAHHQPQPPQAGIQSEQANASNSYNLLQGTVNETPEINQRVLFQPDRSQFIGTKDSVLTGLYISKADLDRFGLTNLCIPGSKKNPPRASEQIDGQNSPSPQSPNDDDNLPPSQQDSDSTSTE